MSLHHAKIRRFVLAGCEMTRRHLISTGFSQLSLWAAASWLIKLSQGLSFAHHLQLRVLGLEGLIGFSDPPPSINASLLQKGASPLHHFAANLKKLMIDGLLVVPSINHMLQVSVE